MNIIWLGHSCFVAESAGWRVVLDPYYVETYPALRDEADEALCSHGHRDHAFLEAVTLSGRDKSESPFTVETVSTFHDDKKGSLRGENAIHILRTEGLTVVHCGDLGHELSEKQLAAKFEGILRYVLPFINDRSLPDTDTKRGTARAAEYTERAVEYIRHSFHTGIRPTDVAEYLGVTEKYLCKLFRVRYGMTPEMFLSKCRSDKAQRLLRTTSLDIRTISSLCGFDDPTYFARWFRKKSGVSATGYREMLDENSKSAAEKGAADER